MLALAFISAEEKYQGIIQSYLIKVSAITDLTSFRIYCNFRQYGLWRILKAPAHCVLFINIDAIYSTGTFKSKWNIDKA